MCDPSIEYGKKCARGLTHSAIVPGAFPSTPFGGTGDRAIRIPSIEGLGYAELVLDQEIARSAGKL